MPHSAPSILQILDAQAADLDFPALDNGYFYPAATRLSAYRSAQDWAVIIEVFGYATRADEASVIVTTLGSTVRLASAPERFATPEAFQRYQRVHAHMETHEVFPIPDAGQSIGLDGREVVVVDLRGVPTKVSVPAAADREQRVVAVLRSLAQTHRDQVLTTPQERMSQLPSSMTEILRLDDWQHPDVTAGELPSNTESFRLIAEALAHQDPAQYRPTEKPNTHWSHWPDAGTL
ncbi:hypothetical protein [Cellulomonas sp. NPDC089187]|uniref:DUF7003 family protein n=1 Tax=Cellulomonas sp. NPDC089187 TaxID=3154970 RepID=UPI003440A3DC